MSKTSASKSKTDSGKKAKGSKSTTSSGKSSSKSNPTLKAVRTTQKMSGDLKVRRNPTLKKGADEEGGKKSISEKKAQAIRKSENKKTSLTDMRKPKIIVKKK